MNNPHAEIMQFMSDKEVEYTTFSVYDDVAGMNAELTYYPNQRKFYLDMTFADGDCYKRPLLSVAFCAKELYEFDDGFHHHPVDDNTALLVKFIVCKLIQKHKENRKR